MSHLFETYNRFDIELVRGEGTHVVDRNGKSYLDFISGIAVSNLGHCHPKVVSAVKEQADQLWHVSNLFQSSLQERAAQLLIDSSDGDAVFFCNSGAEANEAALKLARKHTKKTKVITFKQSFHGRTFATMAATGQSKIHDGFGPKLQEFIYLPYNDLDAVAQTIDNQTAAVMLEVIQGEGGVHPANTDFLKQVESLCKQYGALLIIDEIQTGIGRTGKPFAYQHYGISPDIVTTAKGLGNGFPVGAMIGKSYLKESFGVGVHGSTFAGNNLAMAAVIATLEEVMQETFLDEVVTKGETLKQQLEASMIDCKDVITIRGKGLLLGIQCEGDCIESIRLMREQGLLVLPAGPSVIRLLPPLTVTKEECEQAIEIIKQTLKK
ncbi:acetylornithine transaminase [Bacillus solimangrovi]|uniref:Acetylornithine aminotransferase n=1 Tax=Bacillus solimangrovi TaxID=1305675 RepID=A0A1E5LC28_9BACI|nr:acetylornithine transaminase [Bacillus solimangrovi]OEH91642.1 acetylornithine aminotransferase [Bacillus solimangrovi]